jgi:hypothetical protein
MRVTSALRALLLMAAALPACADAELHPDTQLAVLVSELVHKEGLNEARLLHPESKPWLAFTSGGIHRLEHLALDPSDWDLLESVLDEANRDAMREATYRWEELSEESQREISDVLLLRDSPSALKKRILEAFLHLGAWEKAYVKKLSPSERAQWIEETLESLEASIKDKGRTVRQILYAPGAPFIWGWVGQHTLHEDHGPNTPDFGRYLLYSPSCETPIEGPSTSLSEKELLRRYAPLLVQERPEAPEYSPDSDRIGALEWAPDGAALRVNVSKPALYAYAQNRRIRGKHHKQLVYAYWYPEHPKLKAFDAEAGPIEGMTLRVTLDTHNDPLLFETVFSCGCFHRVFPTERLEAAAKREYGPPLDGKTFSIERKVPRKIDLFVLETVPDRLDGQRPVIYCWAGTHLPGKVDIGFAEETFAGMKIGDETYELHPYREMELTRSSGHVTSVFDRNGLVRNSDRMETYLLAPTGLFHAGTPRQRGTQMIHFDQQDFEDPSLYEERLRWPSKIP